MVLLWCSHSLGVTVKIRPASGSAGSATDCAGSASVCCKKLRLEPATEQAPCSWLVDLQSGHTMTDCADARGQTNLAQLAQLLICQAKDRRWASCSSVIPLLVCSACTHSAWSSSRLCKKLPHSSARHESRRGPQGSGISKTDGRTAT